MSSDSKNCVGFSVIELEPNKHVIKLGRSGWFRRIYCLRDNCGVTEGSIRQNIFRFRKISGKQYKKPQINLLIKQYSMFVPSGIVVYRSSENLSTKKLNSFLESLYIS